MVKQIFKKKHNKFNERTGEKKGKLELIEETIQDSESLRESERNYDKTLIIKPADSNKLRKRKKKLNKQIRKAYRQENEVNFEGERGFASSYGYLETDSYLFVGKHTVLSVFDVLIQYGTNNPAPIGWLSNLIPRDQIPDGEIFFVQRQHGMDKSEETEIVEKRLRSNMVTTANADSENAREDSKNQAKITDMSINEALAGQEDIIIDSDVRLVVRASSPEKVELAIDELKFAYKNYDIKGIILIRRIGEQLKEMKNLFTGISADPLHPSDMSTVSSGRLFLPSSGFSDELGTLVGYDVRSILAKNPSIIDFHGIKNAVVFMGGVRAYISVGGIEGGGFINSDASGSAIANVITEGSTYLEGQRTHHIVLSDFDYHAGDNLYFDMAKEAINPFEVFGTPETVRNDAESNFDKATEMMMMLAGSNEAYVRSELHSSLVDWFIYRAGGGGMYTDNPTQNPTRANMILATTDHSNYPLPMQFLVELGRNVAASSNVGERAQQQSQFIYSTMKDTFTMYNNVFGKATSLPDSFSADKRNIYYDLSKVSTNPTVKGAVFLNVLAYVANRALPGEVIVIHGLDEAKVPVEPLIPYAEKIRRKNVGLITVFEKSENKDVNIKTFGRFIGRLSRQDMVVLGGVTEEELETINSSWQQDLPKPVSDQLLSSADGIVYFYRKRDRVGALVDTHLIL